MRGEEPKCSKSNEVLFWEHILEILFQNIDKIIDKKRKYLNNLIYLSLDALTYTQANQIQWLENEIELFTDYQDIISNLKNAYVSSTAKNADLLIFLDCQNWALKKENQQLLLCNADLKSQINYLDHLSDTLLRFILQQRKEVNHV